MRYMNTIIFIYSVDKHTSFLRQILIEQGRACIDERWRSKGRAHVCLALWLVPFCVAWDEGSCREHGDAGD